MQLLNFFYGIFLISSILIIWFKTDVVLHYARLFGIQSSLLDDYESFVTENPNLYFPDFLYLTASLQRKILCFAFRLLGCPFCLALWLSLVFCLIVKTLMLLPAIYVCSLFIFFQIKKIS